MSQKRKEPEGVEDGEETTLQLGPPMAHEPMLHRNHQPSQLARLPHELLIQIIEPILIHDEPLLLLPKLRFVRTKTSTRGNAWSPLVSILLACRAMYFAGIEVFYGRNTLHFVEALHLRKLVETRLSYDQRWSVTAIRLTVAWQKGRGRDSPWRLLHDCDSCAEWKDVLEHLPRLRRVIMRNVTEFKKADLMTQMVAAAFEARMQDEIGTEKSEILAFEWPLSNHTV